MDFFNEKLYIIGYVGIGVAGVMVRILLTLGHKLHYVTYGNSLYNYLQNITGNLHKTVLQAYSLLI